QAVPLAEPAAGDPIAATLRDLAIASQARLFPGDAGVEIVRVETGPERHHNENRFHRAVTVHYRRAGVAGVLPVWVKFRPGLDRLFPVLAGYHERLGGELIPAPYFAWHSEDEQVALLGGEFIA